MPVFNLAIIEFDDVSPTPSTTQTVSDTGTYSIAADATPVGLRINDDENEFDDGFIDPPGNSTAANNQVLEEAVVVNGTTFAAGGQVELEFAITTTAGDTFYYVRIAGVNVGLTGPSLPPPGLTYTIASSADGQDDLYDNIVCFTAGTRIATPTGERPVETLSAGDLVTVADGPAQPVRWIGRRNLSRIELATRPHLRPIRFEAGALGNARALTVSPLHRMVLRSWRGELMFDEPEVLAPAKALVNDKTIRPVASDDAVHYVHILFDHHQIVFAEGIPTESFHPGATAMKALDRAAQTELFEIFPELQDDIASYGAPARPILRMHEARVLGSELQRGHMT